MVLGQRDDLHLQLMCKFGMEALYTSLFTDKTYSGKILSYKHNQYTSTYMFLYTHALLQCTHCHIRQDVQRPCAAMEELFTPETALVHGVAGFTAKSGCQAAVETVADPEGPAGADQVVSWEAVTAAQACEVLWAILAKRLWTSERVLPLLKSSRASFLGERLVQHAQ